MALKYRDAGVDIDAGDLFVERIKPLVASTRIAEVVGGLGGFAGLCEVPKDVPEPLLVSSADGVGTKLKLAFALDKHDTVGIDLVAMNVNDLITTGARPLFFLDYFASAKLEIGVAEQVIAGIAEGCRQSSCALLGGETAELPGLYAEGEYDLAGFAVGVVSRQRVLGPSRVRVGDAVIGVASSGLHSNGFSLAQKVLLETMGLSLEARLPGLESSLGETLLTPTRIYVRSVAALSQALGDGLHALCHITGGGIPGNLPRVLPQGTVAEISDDHPVPAIFEHIARGGPVELAEMRRTFNRGIGLLAVVAPADAEQTLSVLADAGERAFSVGRVVAGAAEQGARVVYPRDS